MLFSASVLSMLVAYVAAQTANFDPITSPRSGQPVSTGSTLQIVWEDTVSEPITITLLQGASQGTLQLGDVIAKSIDSSLGTYPWKVDPSVAGYATYGFKLSLDSNPDTFQYSFPFVITASSSSSVASSSTLAVQNAQAVSQATKTVVVSSASNTETSAPSSETSSSPFVNANSTKSASAPQVTFPSSSNSTGSGSNHTFTSTTKSASKSASLTTSASKVPGSVVTGSPTSTSGTPSKSSSAAISEAAVQCLSLMGALGLSVAMIM